MENIDLDASTEAVTETLNTLASMSGHEKWDYISNALAGFLPKLLAAAILLLVGLILVRLLIKFLSRLLGKSKLDPVLSGFLTSILRAVLYIVLGVVALSVLVPDAVGMLVALLSVFGLAISLAVKDSLANLAGGFSVLLTGPFTLNDFVSINGTEGVIQEIRLNYTVLKTYDNTIIHIPNGDVAKAQIVNYTCQHTRRLDLTVSIGYGDDFEQAEKILAEIVAAHPAALAEPAPFIRMIEHGDSAIHIACRVWCDFDDFFSLKCDLLEEIKRRFDAAGISIPYQQLDVHINPVPAAHK